MPPTYRVFKRRPWKRNPAYPGGWEPYGGARKTTVGRGLTYSEALRRCQRENANVDRSKPGKTLHEFEQE